MSRNAPFGAVGHSNAAGEAHAHAAYGRPAHFWIFIFKQ
jgi:hypothetical protein